MPKARAADAATTDTDPWGNWRYIGPAGRVYMNVPVTPEPGDVICWPAIPAEDGAWEPTDEPITRQPDNWRPELPAAEPETAETQPLRST